MENSFNDLYVHFYHRVYNTCLLILKNHALSEEATQDSFLKAYENIGSLKDSTKFGSWVASIAARNAINIYNRNKKTFSIESYEIIDHLVDPILKVLDNVEQNELKKDIKTAITKLRYPLDQLIVLKYYWEMTDSKIATTLDMPIGSVKSSLYRAKQMLSRILLSIDKDFRNIGKRGEKYCDKIKQS